MNFNVSKLNIMKTTQNGYYIDMILGVSYNKNWGLKGLVFRWSKKTTIHSMSSGLNAWQSSNNKGYLELVQGSQITWGQFVQSQPLRAWKLELTISHGVLRFKSQVWHGCLHGNTFWRWGLGLVLRVRLSK